MNTTPTTLPVTTSQSPRALLKTLREQFAVFHNSLPLAIGTDKALLERMPDLERKVLRIALSMHTRSLRYLRAMEKATHRFDLDGAQAEEVTDAHRQHASETLRERLKKEAQERKAKLEAAKVEEANRIRTEKLTQLAEKFSRK
ncbi:MAG: ProQ/FINO family protein [Azovibrio sp.]